MSDQHPAELLRRAAALMRDRAEVATEGPWAWEATGDKDSSWAVGFVQDEEENTLSGRLDAGQGVVIEGICESINGHIPDAEHIASWHPGVALAVAGWLENEAAAADALADEADLINLPDKYAIALARAYLGEETTP